MAKRIYIGFMLSLVMIFCFLIFQQVEPAEEYVMKYAEAGFPKDATYDIYYKVSNFEVDMLKKVKIMGVTRIDKQVFLVAGPSSIMGGKDGFIRLDVIQAILPSGNRKPERTYGIVEGKTDTETSKTQTIIPMGG